MCKVHRHSGCLDKLLESHAGGIQLHITAMAGQD